MKKRILSGKMKKGKEGREKEKGDMATENEIGRNGIFGLVEKSNDELKTCVSFNRIS